MAICDHVRGRPRTCTAECADIATCNDNCGKLRPLVADLVINPETGQAEPINIQQVLSKAEYVQLREQMQQLLDMIMLFFEEEEKLVDSGELQAEGVLLHYVQTNDSSTQSNTRSLPEGFKRLRA